MMDFALQASPEKYIEHTGSHWWTSQEHEARWPPDNLYFLLTNKAAVRSRLLYISQNN